MSKLSQMIGSALAPIAVRSIRLGYASLPARTLRLPHIRIRRSHTPNLMLIRRHNQVVYIPRVLHNQNALVRGEVRVQVKRREQYW
jgi:hypothetical protein